MAGCLFCDGNEKVILGLCNVSLTPEYPVVNWASTDTFALSAGMQLLSLPFLECWDAKYGKLSGF